jgi:hypothetical protein
VIGSGKVYLQRWEEDGGRGTRGTGCIQYRATEALGATREPSDEKMSADGNTGGKEDEWIERRSRVVFTEPGELCRQARARGWEWSLVDTCGVREQNAGKRF